MCDGVDHHVKDDSCEHSIAIDEREMWLSLSTKTNAAFVIIAADPLTQHRILHDDTKGKHVEFCICCNPLGAVGMLE